MGIEVELSVRVEAEPEIVWKLLENPSIWNSWWKHCLHAEAKDGRSLHDGSELEVVLQPKFQKITLRPVVDLYTLYKTLSLTHRSTFLESTTIWYLNEKDYGTYVVGQTIFNGVYPFLMSLLQQRGVVEYTLNTNLRALKRAAERLV